MSTPATNAWGLLPASRVWVGGHDLHARRAVEQCLRNTERPSNGMLDAAFITPASVEEALYFAKKLSARLSDPARLWIAYLDARAGPEDRSSRWEPFDRALVDIGLARVGLIQVGSQLMTAGYARTAEHPGSPPMPA